MSSFKYKDGDASGKAVEGVVEKENQRNPDEKPAENDMVLETADPVRTTEKQEFNFGKVKRREIVLFTNHLADSVEEGVSISRAISDYGAETENERFQKTLVDLETQVQAGTSLSDALAKHPGAFPEMYVAIVAAGEATGQLDRVLRDLAQFLEWQEDLDAQVKRTFSYTSFLIVMITGVIVIMITFTFPRFIPILEGFSVELPAPTRILISVSGFFQDYWWTMLGGAVLFFIVYILTNLTSKGKYFWDRVKLGMPLFGKLLHTIKLSRFAHYFNILYSSGNGVNESFAIIRRAMDNEVLREAVGRCADSVEQGGTIYDSLKEEKTFPLPVRNMFQEGESTSDLDRALQKMSRYYDKKVPASIKKMYAIFESLLIIALAAIVVYIALSIFLPVYKLITNI
jgi:type IV pilus assembly protein PilC